MEPQTHGDGPYRSAPLTPPPRSRLKEIVLVCTAAASAVALGAFLLPRSGSPPRAVLAEAPHVLLEDIGSFPPPLAELPPSTPLAPLLARDAPESLAVIAPREGATRVRRGGSLEVRFNRPMVTASAVGQALDETPLRMSPSVEGSTRWLTRSTLSFVPAASVFDRAARAPVEVALTFDADTASLDGEILWDDTPRTLVFDGAPRVRTHRSRVMSGEPLAVWFDSRVGASDFSAQMFAYEIGGGSRALPVRVATRGEDSRGYLVELSLARSLEPGARIGVSFGPRFLSWGGSSPGLLEFEMAPRPRITGIGCEESEWGTAGCAYDETPGDIVDIGPELRVLASHALRAPTLANVRVTPAVPRLAVALGGQSTEAGRHLILSAEWAPDQVYEVRFSGLATAEGQGLLPVSPLAVRSAGHTPTVRATSGRLAFERAAAVTLPFRGIHLDTGRALVRRVEPGRELDALLFPSSFVTVDDVQASSLQALAPDARPNRWARGELELLPADGTPGMVVAALQPGTQFRASSLPTTFVQRTDLGISAQAVAGGVLVWVTSISAGTPVEGASVRLATASGETLSDATTDAHGLAWSRLDGERGATVTHAALETRTAIRVTHDGDSAVMLLDPRVAVGPGSLGLSPGERALDEASIRATVIADRGAYRPGESMSALALVRRMEGVHATVVRSGRAALRLMASDGNVIAAEDALTPDAHGVIDARFELPAGAPLGTHTLEALLDDVVVGRTSVEIAQFRQPSFRVDLAPPVGPLMEGDAMPVVVRARYLFGAALSGATVRWTISRRAAASMPVRWREFSFAPAGTAVRAATLTEGEGQLDAEGLRTIEATVGSGAGTRADITIEAEVRDAAGQTTSAVERVTVRPAAVEVGVRRGDEWVGLGSALDHRAVVIDAAGAPVAGHAVTLRFVREGWHGWYEWHDGGEEDEGAFRLRRSQQREVVRTCSAATDAEGLASCAETPARPGTYLLEAEVRDADGRRAVASRRVYVAGPDEHPDRDPPGAPVALTPARRQWTVGEDAELAFECPWGQAEALITVTRGSLISAQRMHVGSGGQVVRVEITEAMVPNATVTLTLVRPREGEPDTRVDLGAPDLRFGAAELSVRPRTSALAVSIERDGPETLRPGVRETVRVRVADASGAAVAGAHVTLWAVDEGTLRLTGYQVPDPTRGLYVEQAPAFALDDLRRALVSRLPGALEPEASGDGGEGNDPEDLTERERYEPTPLWAPRLVTDADGMVRAELVVPDRTTEYRVMAIAVQDSREGARAGRASASITVTQPLVVRAALPRFATEGDSLMVRGFVHNPGDAPISARVTARIEGREVELGTVEIAARGEARVATSITAPEVSDAHPSIEVALRAEAEVGGERVTHAIEGRIPITPRARWVRRHVVTGGTGERTVAIQFPEGTSERGRMDVAVATHPFVGLGSDVDDVLESAWSSTEVDAWGVLAAVAGASLREGLTLRAGEEEARRARAERALARLVDRQAHDGGFATWRGDGATQPYATALATWALVRAEAAGWAVDETARERAVRALGELVRGGRFGESYGSSGLEAQLFALRVLREADVSETERVDAAFAQREFLTPYGLASLVLAMDEDDARRDAVGALLTRRVIDDRDGLVTPWTRDVRTLSAAVAAASVLPSMRRHLDTLASDLLRQRDPGSASWGGPMATGAALVGLVACADLFREDTELAPTIAIDGEALAPLAASASGAIARVPFARVASGAHAVTARAEAEDALFLSLSARWAETIGEPEAVARGRGITLHRVLETTGGAALADGASVPLGTMVRVRLYIHVERHVGRTILVRDPLGAGFEAVDPRLETTPQASLAALLGSTPEDDTMDPRGRHASRTLGYLQHRELDVHHASFYLASLPPGLHEVTYAVRATTPGRFSVVPARIEALDDPALVARSTALTLTVEP